MHDDHMMDFETTFRRAQGVYDPYPNHPNPPMSEYPKRGWALSARGYAVLLLAAIATGAIIAAIVTGRL